MWLKVERFSLQFMYLNLLRTNRNENWTFSGSPFSITIWRVYLSSGGRTKDLLQKPYFGILSTNLVLQFNLSTDSFLQVERTFLARHLHQKLAFSAHFIAYAWIQNIPSNLRRHKKDKNNRTNFTYVRVTLIFQGFACIRKNSNRA